MSDDSYRQLTFQHNLDKRPRRIRIVRFQPAQRLSVHLPQYAISVNNNGRVPTGIAQHGQITSDGTSDHRLLDQLWVVFVRISRFETSRFNNVQSIGLFVLCPHNLTAGHDALLEVRGESFEELGGLFSVRAEGFQQKGKRLLVRWLFFYRFREVVSWGQFNPISYSLIGR